MFQTTCVAFVGGEAGWRTLNPFIQTKIKHGGLTCLVMLVLEYKYLSTVHCTLIACGLFLPAGQEVHCGQHLPDKSTPIRNNKSFVLMNATEQYYTLQVEYGWCADVLQ